MAENSFTNPGFWEHFVIFPRKNSKTQSSLNFLQFGPRKFRKSDFSGLAPIRRVLTLGNGRNTVSRVLFRRRELTEFYGKLGEFCEKLGEFALAHK